MKQVVYDPGDSIALISDAADPANRPTTTSRKRYWPFLPKAYWFFYRKPIHFLLFVPAFVSSWINTYSTMTMGVILDALTGNEPDVALKIISRRVLMNFLFAVAAAILQFINHYGWATIGSLIGIKIKKFMFKAMMKKDIEFFDARKIGDLLTLLSEDVESLKNSFSQSKSWQIRMIGALITNLALSFSIEWRLSCFAIISTGLAALISRVFRNLGRDQMKLGRKAMTDSVTIAEEAISNARVVFSFNRQEVEGARFKEQLDAHASRSAISRMAFATGWSLSQLLDWGSVCCMLNLGCYLVVRSSISPGSLFALSRMAFSIGMQLNGILGTIQTETKALEAASRIFEVVESAPAVPFDGGLCPESCRGEIEFCNVWFKYPTRDVWILKGVSLRIAPGEIVAFVGHSGSGKSTMLQLLLRFYDVNRGQVLLDGYDIRELDPRWLRRAIGVVLQEPILFAISLRNNVIYGLDDPADDEQIWKALTDAAAAKFSRQLPQQLDNMIGEKGATLSGGQRQRVAIARTLIRNPSVLVTDEATSALDAESERKVQSALDNLMVGRTSIIIAHRLGTIRAAQRIFVFDTGELLEEGTHDSLIEKGGVYFQLVKRQLVRGASEENLEGDESGEAPPEGSLDEDS